MEEEHSLAKSDPPWFYRPEFFIAFFIFPPVWSILALRSPWNNSIIVGGAAWAILIVGAVMCFKWVQNGSPQNLFMFVPGVVLTIITQVQWSRFQAENRPQEDIRGDVTASEQEHSGSSEPARPARPSARRRRRVRR